MALRVTPDDPKYEGKRSETSPSRPLQRVTVTSSDATPGADVKTYQTVPVSKDAGQNSSDPGFMARREILVLATAILGHIKRPGFFSDALLGSLVPNVYLRFCPSGPVEGAPSWHRASDSCSYTGRPWLTCRSIHSVCSTRVVGLALRVSQWAEDHALVQNCSPGGLRQSSRCPRVAWSRNTESPWGPKGFV